MHSNLHLLLYYKIMQPRNVIIMEVGHKIRHCSLATAGLFKKKEKTITTEFHFHFCFHFHFVAPLNATINKVVPFLPSKFPSLCYLLLLRIGHNCISLLASYKRFAGPRLLLDNKMCMYEVWR